MRQVRIYQPGRYESGSQCTLSEEATKHVAVVLRMKEGQSLILFNGQGVQCEASIVSLHKKSVLVEMQSVAAVSRESDFSIELVQAVSKGERMEIVIQKAVELGVARILPVLSQYSVVRLDAERAEKKLAQWRSIAIAACEQCGRNQLPVIEPVMLLHQAVKSLHSNALLMLDPKAGAPLSQLPGNNRSAALVIGPEGGLSDAESELLARQGFCAYRLGPRILRTETAAITAISVLQALHGDL